MALMESAQFHLISRRSGRPVRTSGLESAGSDRFAIICLTVCATLGGKI